MLKTACMFVGFQLYSIESDLNYFLSETSNSFIIILYFSLKFSF